MIKWQISLALLALCLAAAAVDVSSSRADEDSEEGLDQNLAQLQTMASLEADDLNADSEVVEQKFRLSNGFGGLSFKRKLVRSIKRHIKRHLKRKFRSIRRVFRHHGGHRFRFHFHHHGGHHVDHNATAVEGEPPVYSTVAPSSKK